ncbi:F-box/LRR-repeat protein At3g48880-like isoform X1 [Triticum dicoccoides]|uniref:F-box/LRR-repeat protein At3g48880-like isoform X1 n=1 Tax=Triticum dicoccoides TaxID=85692 RepID=UPI000E7AA277|nr:F-box/LRR-repeat protein At3g48880-like isoform X1 [Triticum dicoccoides]
MAERKSEIHARHNGTSQIYIVWPRSPAELATVGGALVAPRLPPPPARSIRDLIIMGESKWMGKRWEEMDTDVLVKIFKELNLVELSPVSQVCRLWRLACSDPLIWGTLDFGLLKSNFIQTRASPYIWVDDRSDKRLAKILRVAMAISRGNVNCMIFHYNLYMKDEHLHYISQRSPHLKRLVMPAWNRISRAGICQAIERWEELESLTMPTIGHPPYIMEGLANNCKNFKELKIMGSFDLLFASAVTTYLPKLKVLSLRCSKVTMGALQCVLNSLEHLEVLNISHCLLFEMATNGRRQVIHELDNKALERASRLREFHHCQSRQCVACQRMMLDEGILRWYRYEDWFWRRDEVRSLDLKDYGRLFGAQCEMLTSVD